MYLQPKKVRWRKQRRGTLKGKAFRGNKLAFGEYGIQALDRAWITQQQIEAVRVALVRSLKKGAKVWIRIFPDKPYTKKPNEVRMGGGKGDPEGFVAVVKPGRILFEFTGVPEEVAQEAFTIAASKLPIPVRLVKYGEFTFKY
ncbi:50S ribosomal protein L16 [Aquifex aeolicus]|uniref:Large ribosomal subunit protein uL16 n=1 Tax=Aquifex aeolicus (strain VF5) TaxID=224324 RepID=RL16_AQUAE|nr:50S ribosomal protein L16 [Aquifex aeolicus]O66438.1 RecName: Full=Large ribosomal subunit protein uL16; AltName: Full=50S ribosomal protein L16 [Aquifex aeolicus VF5]AAC06395.1 ribosomal protein L16 [Aquifex aeolicus VF5]